MAPPPLPKPKQSRTSLRTKTSKSGSGLISRPPPTHRPGAIISDSFISSKKDKRTIKSSAFLNRIQKAHAKPAKRRRPNKKLVANLESLADALPELDEDDKGKVSGKGGMVGTRIKMESLTSGKGLMKRRGKVERVERERFAKNMAQLMGAQQTATTQTSAVKSTKGAVGGGETQPSATATRFAALRNWIGQTMEKEKAFEMKE